MALSLVWGPIGQADASNPAPFQHVLLISIDGMHALDLNNYVASHPNSTLAKLSSTGDTFANASTSEPSNAFPGLMSMTTGGSPRTTGVWYDDAYDRSLFSPQASGGTCSGAPGTQVLYDQSIDFDSTRLDGGGGIDPAKLPQHLVNAQCTPVFPDQFVRVNTIFEAVKAAGGGHRLGG